MFNLQGSEIIFLLLIALVVLGPEKLPDAIRKFGRAYAEFKKMANGFQGELKQVLDEPMRELKDTADAMRNAVNFTDDPASSPAATATDPTLPVTPATPPKREQGLNFGSANPRRTQPADDAAAASTETAAPAAEAPKPGGLNFGAAARRERPARDPLAAAPASAEAAPVAADEPDTAASVPAEEDVTG